MRKLIMLAPIMLCLPAATCSQERPAIEVRTVEVPTPVPCVSADEIPVEPATVGHQFNGQAAHDLAIAVASAIALRIWGQTMHTQLTACAGGAE